MDSVKPSKKLVIQRCLRLMDIREDDSEYEEHVKKLSIKPFTELHELAKKLRIDSDHQVHSLLSALKTSHSVSTGQYE